MGCLIFYLLDTFSSLDMLGPVEQARQARIQASKRTKLKHEDWATLIKKTTDLGIDRHILNQERIEHIRQRRKRRTSKRKKQLANINSLHNRERNNRNEQVTTNKQHQPPLPRILCTNIHSIDKKTAAKPNVEISIVKFKPARLPRGYNVC